MTRRHILLGLRIALAAVASLGSGCWTSHTETSHTETVHERPIVIRESAPPPVSETPGSAPREGATWIPGHWERASRGWLWVTGHWD